MAPTVCSEKKVRVAGMKEVRRRSNMGVAQSNATAAAAAGTVSPSTAGATQNSAVLSYVAKGSLNSSGRQQRRRGVRLPLRLPKKGKAAASSSAPAPAPASAEGGQGREKKAKQVERMEFDGVEFNVRTHSSSSCGNNKNNNNNSNNNIKTVLQPTMANSNSSHSHSSSGSSTGSSSTNGNGGGGIKKSTAKLCDLAPGMAGEEDQDMDEDEEEEDDHGDADSGYEFALEPIKLPQLPPHHYHTTHSEGLLSIAIKTINLVQRNKLLQKRLAQLQLETSKFIASVLANPENRHFREKIGAKTEAANKVSNMLLRH